MTHSWRFWIFNAALACVAVLVLGGAAFGVYHLVAADSGPSASKPATSPGAVPSAAEEPLPVPEESTEPDGSWHTVATTYGTAFTNTEGGIEPWRERMATLVSPVMVQGYSYTDLESIPDEQLLRVSKDDVPVAGEEPSRMVRLFYTGDLVVDITMSWNTPEGGGWVITSAVPVDNPDRTPLPDPYQTGDPARPV